MPGPGGGLRPHVTARDDSRRTSWLLGLLFGLVGMGSSSAAIALPLMGPDLGVSVGNAAWTISLYALMLAVTTAVYGRVSDLVGVRLPLLFGVSLMTVGALVSAAAPSFGVLVVARMIQGAGAAAVPTLGVAALSARYDGEIRGLALMLLTDARRPARTGPGGELVPLDEQDRSLWDGASIGEGARLVARALSGGTVGPYAL